jgi:GT2 family glycosyltransferase
MTEPAAQSGSDTPNAPAAGGRVSHVVVIVLTWCREDDTAECLASLAASHWPRLTVLLVDNASADGSGERLHARFPDVAYLQTGENLGYTGGNNRGFEWALAHGADHIVVLNNDTVVDPACIGHLVRAAEADARIGGVSPKILVHGAPDVTWFAGGDLSLMRGTALHRGEYAPDGDGGVAGPITFMTGCCFLLTRAALERVGGFEESFFAYNEDVDLSYRLLEAGYTLRYEPRARLDHKVPPPGTPRSAFQITQLDRNRRRFVALRLGRLARLRFAAWFYSTRALLLAWYLLHRDGTRARAVVRGAIG